MSQPIYFAIGDIHGEADKLRAMHDGILDRILFEKLPAVIVHLGDYVDRGPDSRRVIEQILALEAMFEGSSKVRVISLRGNHEQMMLDAFDADILSTDVGGHWFMNGGGATADSYAGRAGLADRNWRNTIPKEHIAFLRRLPTIWRAEDFVFVHAGIDPATFPDDDEEVRIWTRSNNFTDTSRWPKREELRGITVIHGHTPQDAPEIEPQRINVDTGACYGGPLTCVVLQPGKEPSFLIAG
jgi:serine/threonine protein phosphatase 1